MDLDFLAQADTVALKLELAKQAIDAAKIEFESCKKAYEELISRAEDHGIPRAKLKKLTEERVQALFDSGMVTRPSSVAELPIKKKAKSKAKRPASEEEIQATTDDAEFDDLANTPSPDAEA